MHKKTPPKTVEQIKMMMYVGTRVVDIAKATGVSRSRIYEIRNDLIEEQQQLIREFSAPITVASDARKRLSKLMGFVSSFSSGVSAEEERKKINKWTKSGG